MMTRKKFLAGILITVLALAPLMAENRISVRIEPGEHWFSRMWVFIFPVNKAPQIAVWIETMDGEYVDTLTVTGRTATQDWRSAPEGGRPESLPVWSHASANSDTDLDAASTATPEEAVRLERGISRLRPGEQYVVRAEVNHSFDYNEYWPKNEEKESPRFSGVNGQPSVVYEGYLVNDPGNSIVLTLAGHGSVNGSGGVLEKDITGLTTALSIVETVTVIIDSE